MQAEDLLLVQQPEDLRQVCSSLGLGEAECDALAQAFMSVAVMASQDDCGLLKAAQYLQSPVPPMVMLTVRDQCRAKTDALSSFSKAPTEPNAHNATAAPAPAPAPAPAKKRSLVRQKPSAEGAEGKEGNEENGEPAKEKGFFPTANFPNDKCLFGTGIDLLHQDVQDGLDYVVDTISRNVAMAEDCMTQARWLVHFHGKRHRWNLQDAQIEELLYAMKDYLHTKHKFSVEANFVSSLVPILRNFSSQLRNKGTGAIAQKLPPTLHVDLDFIKNEMPPAFAQKYVANLKKSSKVDNAVYTFVLGQRDKRKQLQEREQLHSQDVAAAAATDNAAKQAVANSTVLQALAMDRSSGVAADGMADAMTGSAAAAAAAAADGSTSPPPPPPTARHQSASQKRSTRNCPPTDLEFVKGSLLPRPLLLVNGEPPQPALKLEDIKQDDMLRLKNCKEARSLASWVEQGWVLQVRRAGVGLFQIYSSTDPAQEELSESMDEMDGSVDDGVHASEPEEMEQEEEREEDGSDSELDSEVQS